MMSLLEFFGLRENPFSITIDSRFFYSTRQHAEALIRLKYAVENMKGLAIVVGDVGTGKTTLATRLLEELGTEEYEAALLIVIHAAVTSEWMLRKMALQMEISTPGETKTELLTQLSKRLAELFESGKKAVVLIDEAQMLRSQELMEDFRGLLNIEIDSRKVVTFVLFGLPELDEVLALDRPLHQRVAIRYQLTELDAPVDGAGCAGNRGLRHLSLGHRREPPTGLRSGYVPGDLPVQQRHAPPDQHPLRQRTARSLPEKAGANPRGSDP
jgi:type II secretory pathway predicted ATPase ExeA